MIQIGKSFDNEDQKNKPLETTQEKPQEKKISVPMRQPISEEEMIGGQDLVFGQIIDKPSIKFKWNPDGDSALNGHLMMLGGSGSGKTRMLKHISKYLKNLNKEVILVDFHGDMNIEGTTSYVLSPRKSEWGVNFFRLSKDPVSGGPNAQSMFIASLFKKNFADTIGPVQNSVLVEFLINCYRYVGILDEDESTWDKPLPNVKTMFELLSILVDYNGNINSFEIGKLFDEVIILKAQSDELEKDGLMEEKEKINKKLDKKMKDYLDWAQRLSEYVSENKNHTLFEKTKTLKNIELAPYSDKKNVQTLKSLVPYFNMLKNSSVFVDYKKEIGELNGLVHINLKSLTNVEKPFEAMFVADIIMQEELSFTTVHTTIYALIT